MRFRLMLWLKVVEYIFVFRGSEWQYGHWPIAKGRLNFPCDTYCHKSNNNTFTGVVSTNLWSEPPSPPTVWALNLCPLGQIPYTKQYPFSFEGLINLSNSSLRKRTYLPTEHIFNLVSNQGSSVKILWSIYPCNSHRAIELYLLNRPQR